MGTFVFTTRQRLGRTRRTLRTRRHAGLIDHLLVAGAGVQQAVGTVGIHEPRKAFGEGRQQLNCVLREDGACRPGQPHVVLDVSPHLV